MQCFRDARQVAQSYRLHASSDISSAMKKQGRKGAGSSLRMDSNCRILPLQQLNKIAQS